MDPIAEFFTRNIIVVYFIYGLAFLILGMIIWLESRSTYEFRIAAAFSWLAAFGIIHGLHEWFEMFQKLSEAGAANIPEWLLIEEIRIPHLVVSFLLLIIFGVRLIYSTHRKNHNAQRASYFAAGIFFIIWLASLLATRWIYNPTNSEFIDVADVLSRYTLAIPGALLAAWAIILEQRAFRKRGMVSFGRDLRWAAWTLILYGVVGQMFPKESILFPSTVINSQLFIDIIGIPIQFFRAAEAMLMAIFFISALRAFEFERQQHLAQANEDRLEAQREALVTHQRAQEETEKFNRALQQREKHLGELLHQVVTAQENERQRVARELHDGTGQILTGLGLGLAATGESLPENPELAMEQLTELGRLNDQAMQDLRDVISDLRPSVLDDLGLVPAFQAQIRSFESRTGVTADFELQGRRRRLSQEIETIVFRIGQEALTNVGKHARAKTVTVQLRFQPVCLRLLIQDDGLGFDPEEVLSANGGQRRAWGLLGIQERVALVGGACEITSQPGSGTLINVTIPLEETGEICV
jgi:signal transduction histidine kinase